jgi:hypothetical protein
VEEAGIALLTLNCESLAIRIGAAEASGKAWDWNGNADYILTGEKVKQEREMRPKSTRPLTGCSVATALAAGLDLHCGQLSAIYVHKNTKHISGLLEIEDYNTMKQKEFLQNMKDSFKYIGPNKDSSSYQFIKVWDKFEDAAEKLENADMNRKDLWLILAELVRNW